MKRTEAELKLPPEKQFRDVVSPPIFLLITVIAAHAFEVALVGNSKLIDDGVGLAAMITDNTTLILFRLVAFALVPVIAGVFALAVMRRPVDRDTLQPFFYAQCFATTPVVLLCSVAETITQLPQPAANIPAGLLFAAATLFYIGVETSWFAREAKRGRGFAALWAVAALAISVIVLAGTVLLFSGL
jgi:hypothetical protein